MPESTADANPDDDPTYQLPPPGWDPDDDWEPSNNDAMNYNTDPDDPDDFYEP